MAVAAYASLVSLTHVLDNLHYRAQFHLPRVDINQLGRLQDNIRALLEFVELHSEAKYPGVGGLWRQISEVAFEAEDRIDFHAVNLLHKMSQQEIRGDHYKSFCGKTMKGFRRLVHYLAHEVMNKTMKSCGGQYSSSFSSHSDKNLAVDTEFLTFCEDMEILISKTGDIRQELLCIKEEEEEGVQAPSKQPVTLIPNVGPTTTTSRGKDFVVGLEDHVVRIMDVLTRDQSNLKILPIIGMGGIGKTTLAKRVFDDPYVVNHFDKRIWLTISQEYSVEQILMGLVNDGVVRGTSESSTSADLGLRLHQHLFGRRYLVVLDDVWAAKAWDDLKRFFPNNGNGSRVMLTTRNSDVAECVGSYNPYSLGFLDEDKSWNLFCENAFSQKGCPYSELEEIAKAIVKCCRGLPLEIVVLGRMLSSSMTREYWESAAQNISSFANLGDNEHCFKILSLSYTSLPIHLKPCFLYMRIFHEDALIDVHELINLWVAEGFIKTEAGRSLEDIGVEYLKNLVARNLVYVKKWTIGRKMKYCGMHDLLRDLCLKEFFDENFICSPKVQHMGILFQNDYNCFVRGDVVPTKISNELLSALSSSTFKVEPFHCVSCGKKYSSVRMLRALNLGGDRGIEFEPTTLRYLYYHKPSLSGNYWLFSTIHLFWNIHTIDIFHFITTRRRDFPSEIWEMPQLRMLHAQRYTLRPIEGKKSVSLKHLHSLSAHIPDNCFAQVAARIPNLRALCLPHDRLYDRVRSLCNLFELNNLETLHLYGFRWKSIVFPKSLKELSLYDCGIPWIEMTIIGSLPNLEELTISEIEGSEWDPIEGEFLQLKGLCVKKADLVHWRADQDHFPKLEWLSLYLTWSLEAIPLGIGDIPTLHTIEIEKCNDSVVSSAQLIWEEQQSMGNDTLQIHVTTEDEKYTLGGGYTEY